MERTKIIKNNNINQKEGGKNTVHEVVKINQHSVNQSTLNSFYLKDKKQNNTEDSKSKVKTQVCLKKWTTKRKIYVCLAAFRSLPMGTGIDHYIPKVYHFF